MALNPQSGPRLRPVDLAREHGLSTQAVRNYEDAGILPTAVRTPSGYRSYTLLHAHALRAFLALIPAHGHKTATAIMRAVNDGADADALGLVDESHAQLLDDRRTLQAVEHALSDLDPAGSGSGSEPPVPPTEPRETFIGPLATKLRIRPATLRTWERAGLVHPRRDHQTGYRVYDEAAVLDARLTHQLRRGGLLLEQIAPLIAQVRSAGGLEPLQAALTDWHDGLSARGRAMLAGAAALLTYLDERPVLESRADGGHARVPTTARGVIAPGPGSP